MNLDGSFALSQKMNADFGTVHSHFDALNGRLFCFEGCTNNQRKKGDACWLKMQ
jgi:hypothetical protein